MRSICIRLLKLKSHQLEMNLILTFFGHKSKFLWKISIMDYANRFGQLSETALTGFFFPKTTNLRLAFVHLLKVIQNNPQHDCEGPFSQCVIVLKYLWATVGKILMKEIHSLHNACCNVVLMLFFLFCNLHILLFLFRSLHIVSKFVSPMGGGECHSNAVRRIRTGAAPVTTDLFLPDHVLKNTSQYVERKNSDPTKIRSKKCHR